MSFFKSKNNFRRKNKYGAKRTSDGFPSKLEAAVYQILLLKERAGEITDIKRQQQVVLQDGDALTRITWKVDFSYIDKSTGELVYIEAKGMPTNEYKLKLKIWRKNRPARLEIWTGHYLRPTCIEIIEKGETAA